MRSKSILVVAMAVILLTATELCNAVAYEIIDLGNFGGSAYSHSINDLNQITINRHVGGYYSPAYMYDYDNDTLTNLGSLYGGDTRAYEINNSGQIVGQSKNSSAYNNAAFLYDSGVMREIIPDNYSNEAHGISQNGKVVGEIIDGGFRKGFIYDDGALTIIDIVGYSRDINNDGTVVGWAAGGAFMYKDGSTTFLGFLEGDTDSRALSTNNVGQIVGFSEKDGIRHAFLYHNNTMTRISALTNGTYNSAYAINDIGQVVGYSTISGHDTNNRHAFLYDDGDLLDLGVLTGATYSEAFGINDNGWIVGCSGGGSVGDPHAVLWIPEPATLLLLGIGAVMLRREK